jgi:uncharacterized protein (DUF427 family)
VSAVKVPGPDHPITIEPVSEQVTVQANGRIVAQTKSALLLREASLPPVYYVPLEDVDESLIERSDTHTYCPYKGDASYYNVVTDDGTVVDAVWTYERPYEAMRAIAGHVAFYPHKVEISAGA